MRFLLLFLILFITSCARFFINAHEKRPRKDYSAQSHHAMVVSAHPIASQIGSQILKEGGNAIDAAIATSFAISVLRPQSTGIGGGGFMLVYKPENPVVAYDFRERAPKKASYKMYINTNNQVREVLYNNQVIKNPSVNGHLAVGTPGLIAGLLKAHADHGTLELKKLIMPAIKLAQEGFLVYSDLAHACEDRKEILSKFEDSRRIFLPNQACIKEGQWLIQKDLAWTLQQIANHGLKGFYEGPVSEKILAEIAAGHGILTHEDLKSYEVKIRMPLEASYREHRIVSMPPPSSGGVHIIEMLNILSHFDLKSLGHDNPKTMHILAETMKRAFADRACYLGDPDFVKIPLKKLLSPEHAAKIAASISLSKATPSLELSHIEEFYPNESPSTTHISVVDKSGMAVSTTQTINYAFGSGVVARGTGIVLNDEMDDFSIKPGIPNIYGLVGNNANAIAAKKTMLSSMSPTLVFDPAGKLKLVAGSPGGPRIINATLQTIINIIDHNMSLSDAVHSFRIHHQWLPDIINIEPHGLTLRQSRELKKLGHEFKIMQHIGDVQAIYLKHKNNYLELTGVSDTRSNGKPAY